MMPRTWAACIATPLAFVVCGCQHIAPSPLDINSIPNQLANRALDLPSIKTYAEELVSQQSAEAEPYSLEDGISLDEAAAIAFWYNGNVRRARANAAAIQILPFVSGEITDPALQTVLGEKQTDTESGVEKDWIAEVGLGITIPLSGRMGVARELGDAQFELALRQYQESRWEVARTLQQAWLAWSTGTLKETLYDTQIEQFEKISRMTQNLADAGELDVISSRFFRIEHTRLLATRERVRGDVESARLQILDVMGLVPNAPVSLLPLTRFAPDNLQSETLSPAHPTLKRLEQEYEVAEQALRLELRRQYPDLTLTPGFSDEGEETSITLGFGLPLALWNQNKLGIARAVADRDGLRIQIENTYHQLAHQLGRSAVAYRSSQHQWKHLEDNAVSLLEQQIRQAQLLMDTGELNVVLLNELLRQSLQIRLELLDAMETAKNAEVNVVSATDPDRILSQSDMEYTQ